MSRSQVEGFKPVRRFDLGSAMKFRSTRALDVLGVVIVAYSLAGCGRMAGLDLPPSAGAAPAETETKSLSPIAKPAKPQPAVVPDRKLPIDILLD